MLESEVVDKALAVRINEHFLALDLELNELLRSLQPQMSEDDFREFRRSVGDVLGILYIDIVKWLYVKYPEIKPKGMP